MPSKIAERVNGFSKKVKDAIPSMSGGFLTNKWMLYLVLFSAIFDIFYFYNKNDMHAILIFLVIGFLVSFFSKNMVVILIIAIVFTHLIRFGKELTEPFEGDEEEVVEAFEEDVIEEDVIEEEAFKNKKSEEGVGQLIQTNKELMEEMGQLKPLLEKAEGYLSKKVEGFGDFGSVYETTKKAETFIDRYEKFVPRVENNMNTRSIPR